VMPMMVSHRVEGRKRCADTPSGALPWVKPDPVGRRAEVRLLAQVATHTVGHQPSLGTDRFSAVRPAHARQPRSSTYVLRFVY
jgi:hypothetical protein